MRLTPKTPLPDVAAAVGDALRRSGIRGVLTGGACASLYAPGEFPTVDVDIVLAGTPTVEDLDRALATVGFRRRRDRYVHDTIRFFVEFPRGPLGIGEDMRIRPVWRSRRGLRILTLSATDACRDRLAAFCHWNDRQSLAFAVAIAMANRVQFSRIRRWSLDEGMQDRYSIFLAELARARGSHRTGRRSPPRPRP